MLLWQTVYLSITRSSMCRSLLEPCTMALQSQGPHFLPVCIFVFETGSPRPGSFHIYLVSVSRLLRLQSSTTMPNSGVWLQRRACSVSGCVRRLQGTDGSLTWVGITWLSEWCLYDATNFLAQQGPQLLCFICKKSRSLGSENLKDFSWRSCHKVLKCNENVPDVLFLVKVSICWKDGQIYFCFQLLSWFSFWDSVSVSQVVYLAEVNLELVILCLHFPWCWDYRHVRPSLAHWCF